MRSKSQFLLVCVTLLVFMILTACSPAAATQEPTTQAAPATPTPTPQNTAIAETTPGECVLSPLTAPTPAENPGYTRLDPSTGLHVTGDAQVIDLASYRLKISGLVDHPLELSLDELRCMPKVEATLDLTCPGYFTDHATWAGVPIKYILDLAGIQAGAVRLNFIAADGYSYTFNIEDALKEGNFLAYEWEGQPLPILHGFPLRAVFPGEYGSHWVKWLVEIQVE